MNYIQYLQDEQLQSVVGGSHDGVGGVFGTFTLSEARTGGVQEQPSMLDLVGHVGETRG